MLVRRLLIAAGVLLVGLVATVAILLRPRPPLDYTASTPPHVTDALAFRDTRIAESRAAGVPDHNTERLVLHRAGGSEVVFLYIHGFSASRGEGELVVDTLAAEWSANAWYLRLPGHGGPGEALGEATADQYFDTVTEALGMARRLGDKVVIISTSTGAALAMWAAGTHPDYIDAIVIASPLVRYADPKGNLLLSSAHAEWMTRQILGAERNVKWTVDPEGRKGEHYDRHWTWRYPSKALVHLDDVRRHATRPEVLAKVTQPALLLTYERDHTRTDGTIDLDAAEAAVATFNGGTPHPLTRSVEVEDGTHVLMSEHVRTDKDVVLSAIRDFLRDVVGSPPRERAIQAAPHADGPPPG